jgi:hypothetical protein
VNYISDTMADVVSVDRSSEGPMGHAAQAAHARPPPEPCGTAMSDTECLTYLARRSNAFCLSSPVARRA